MFLWRRQVAKNPSQARYFPGIFEAENAQWMDFSVSFSKAEGQAADFYIVLCIQTKTGEKLTRHDASD